MVTLAAIESELARRTGPYETYTVSGGNTTLVTVPALISTLDTGEYEDRWVLRRDAVAADRQRRIASYDPGTGSLVLDRPVAFPPGVGGVIEIVALDPTQHLRQAARVGLSRCFFEDRITVVGDGAGTWRAISGYTWAQIASYTWAQLLALPGISSAFADRDLTALLPWLTRPGQLRSVQTTWASSTWGPTGVEWWEWFTSGGRVRLATDPNPMPGAFYVTALRPADTWVNDADSTTGPTADADTLAVDLEYAVVAAHKVLWETVPDRLAGYGATEKQVNAGWKVQVRGHVRPPPDRLQLGAPYGALAAAW